MKQSAILAGILAAVKGGHTDKADQQASIDRGENMAKRILWRLSSGASPVDMSVEDRREMVSDLRRAADMLEQHDPTLVGVIFSAGIRHIPNLEKPNECQVQALFHVATPCAMMAAVYLELEKHGKRALNDSLPAVLDVSMSEDLRQYDANT